MRHFSTVPTLASTALLLFVSMRPVDGQVIAQGVVAEGPRFLLASESGPMPVDVDRTTILQRRLSLDLDGALLKDALAQISGQSGLRLTYSDDIIPLDSRIHLRADGITVLAALTDVLIGSGLDVIFNSDSGSRAALVKRPPSPKPMIGSIVGRVTDAATGAALSGASIRLESSRYQTVTGTDGTYRLDDVPAGTYTLLASMLGYSTATASVSVADDETATVDVALSISPMRLDEVVVTATGERRRLEVGNAIGVVDADAIVPNAPIRDVADLLAGRVPGVQVMFPNGVAGIAPRIRIRGINSITVSNDPIIVIDGVRVENSVGFDFGGAQFSTAGSRLRSTGRLADLIPAEIESIDIIKGPSAATLYGTDAANGVIVINTKRGVAGPPQWNAYMEYGLVRPPNTDWYTSYYSEGRNTATGETVQCLVFAMAAGECVQESLATFNPLQDSPSSPLGSGRRQQYGLQVTGGGSQLRYFVSAEAENETGYLRMSDHDKAVFSETRLGGGEVPHEQAVPNELTRFSFRTNLNSTLGNNADVSLSTGLIRSLTRLPTLSYFGGAAWGRATEDTLAQWNGFLPIESLAIVTDEGVTRLTQGLTANWRPAQWLALRTTLGVDVSNVTFSYLARRGESRLASALAGADGARVRHKTDTDNYTADISAVISRLIGPALSSRTAIGVQYNRRKAVSAGTEAAGLAPGSQSVAGAELVTGLESTTESAVAGAYIEETVGFRDRLFVTGALRFDGASSFGQDFRAAVYPKASVSWLVSDQANEGILGLESLRLRVAYGASGVQPSPVAALTRATLLTGLVDGEISNAAAISAVGDTRLRPERQTEFEGGLDAEFANGRVSLELTAYSRQSSDALIDRPFAPSFGLGDATQQINIGEVRNRGIEALLNVRVIDTPDLSWDVSLNANTNRNRLLRLAPDIPFVGHTWIRNVEGYPIFGLWDRPILGYEDSDGDGMIDASEVELGDTAVFFGSIHPTRQLAATSTWTLFDGRVNLTALMDYRGGHKRWNNDFANRCFRTIAVCRELNDPTAPLDRQAAAVAYNEATIFAGYYEDGDFLRVRELAVTLDEPRLARLVRARSASLTLSARNLVTWSNYSGIDVESTNSPGDDGFADNPTAPPGRYFNLRLNLGF